MITLLISRTATEPHGWKVIRNGSIIGFYDAEDDALRHAVNLASFHWRVESIPASVIVETDAPEARVVHFIAGPPADAVPAQLSTSPDLGCDHDLHLYGSPESLCLRLADFILEGYDAGDPSIVIARPALWAQLRHALADGGHSADRLAKSGYLLFEAADDGLAAFMVDGMPDPNRFERFVSRLLRRARMKSRSPRAFGEMVALLWERGNHGATVRLEQLWTTLCKRESLKLLCAYPSSVLHSPARTAVAAIVGSHASMTVD